MINGSFFLKNTIEKYSEKIYKTAFLQGGSTIVINQCIFKENLLNKTTLILFQNVQKITNFFSGLYNVFESNT